MVTDDFEEDDDDELPGPVAVAFVIVMCVVLTFIGIGLTWTEPGGDWYGNGTFINVEERLFEIGLRRQGITNRAEWEAQFEREALGGNN